MAASMPASTVPGADAIDILEPPKKGYAVQYERLLMEELYLKKSREDFLKQEKRGESRTNATDELHTLKIRGMIHRASLEGMLIAAQHADEECKPDTKRLDRTEAKNALASLWIVKSRQLEEDDNRIPHYIGAESLAIRKRISSEIGGHDGSSCSKQLTMLEASADDFFGEFPECRRRDDANEFDESENDDDSDIDNQKPIAKKKREPKKSGSNDEPIIVTCSSGSSSPERSRTGMVNESNDATRNKLQNQPHNNHQKQSSSNWINQNPPNRNLNELNSANHLSHQYSQRQQNHTLPGKYTNNPYQRKSKSTQQNQWQNDHQQDPYQNHALEFDYNDNNMYNKGHKPGPAVKDNPFRTAKELGKNFNNKPREGEKGGCHGEDDDWDNYGNNGNAYSGNDNIHQRTGGRINNKSTSSAQGGPQQMVGAALRGPKNNLSGGLKKQYQNPMKGGSSGGQSSGNGNGNYKNSNSTNRQAGAGSGSGSGGRVETNNEELPEELSGCDKELVEKINNEIVDSGQKVTFDDIAGLENAKKTVYEMVILPMKRPDLFTGLRACPKGMLLFGPPGTGKTLIGKAIAHESGATFFSISSSSLTSKWIGEGEKLVRTLFAVAHYRAPSVVFIDEVDSMLTQRKADENESSRRIKTEFLVQLDGAGNQAQGQVLVIGATNLPHELDDAARRRFVKRLYIPLPDETGRESLLRTLLAKNEHKLKDRQIIKLSRDTDGYSGADLQNLCGDAAMGPVRELGDKAEMMPKDNLPPISYKHFRQSLRGMSPSVAPSDLVVYVEWNDTYGNKVCDDEDIYESDTGSDDESS